MNFQKQKRIIALFLLLKTTFFMTNCNNLVKENPRQQPEQKKEIDTPINISGTWSITGVIGPDGETENPPAGVETLFTFKNDSTYDVSFKKDNKHGPAYSGTYKIMPDSILHTYYVIGTDSVYDQSKIILFEQSAMQIKDMKAAGDIMIFTKKK
ncbi:MAG: lipocalin family protein [Ferruginibacter sp.]